MKQFIHAGQQISVGKSPNFNLWRYSINSITERNAFFRSEAQATIAATRQAEQIAHAKAVIHGEKLPPAS
jgi:hypothetical protein